MNMASTESAITETSLLEDVILTEDDLSEEAKKQFTYHSEVLKSFESYRQSILHNEHLSSMGKQSALLHIHDLHGSFKNVLNYVIVHSEVLSNNLPTFGPLIIVGLPRTGSTLLYNLLACDPNCRAPLTTDMMYNFLPPISRSNFDGQKIRQKQIQSIIQENIILANKLNQIRIVHPRFPIQEDLLILWHTCYFPFLLSIISDEEHESGTCLDDATRKNYIYKYHEIFLRMLNSVDAPCSHWLLKSPFHSLQLDAISRQYPNSALIMTHRRLDETIPSFCSFGSYYGLAYIDQTNPISRDVVTTRCIQFIDKSIESILKFRTSQNRSFDGSTKKIFDVAYNDLMTQPINTIHRIYDHFGLHWSDEFETAMKTWLHENPQGKQGRHTYNLTDYGLTREGIETKYAGYINLFQSSSFSKDVDENHSS